MKWGIVILLILGLVAAASAALLMGALGVNSSASKAKEPEKIDVTWGSGIRPDQLAEAVDGKDYEAVFITHNETSTGVMTPLDELGKIIHEAGALFCVDAVSSMGGVKLPVDELGIDVLVTGTQKCMAVAPGLAMTAVSEEAFEKSAGVENKGFYFDYHVCEKYALKNNTHSTPPIPQIASLNYQLNKILEQEGLENRIRRHRELAEHTRGWMSKHFEMFSEPWCASDTVSCAKNTVEADLAELSTQLGDRGYQFSNGYGKLKGEAFRVAHMGDRTMEDLREYLELIEELLAL